MKSRKRLGTAYKHSDRPHEDDFEEQRLLRNIMLPEVLVVECLKANTQVTRVGKNAWERVRVKGIVSAFNGTGLALKRVECAAGVDQY